MWPGGSFPPMRELSGLSHLSPLPSSGPFGLKPDTRDLRALGNESGNLRSDQT